MAAAAAKAAEELPRITGAGLRQIVYGGPTVRAFWVASRSQPGTEHLVYVGVGDRLVCDCAGSRYRGFCAHRQAVMAALAEESAAIARAQAKEERETCRCIITPKGMEYLKRWRAEQAEQARQEAAQQTDPSGMNAHTLQGASRRSGTGASSATAAAGDECDTALLRRSQRPFSLMK